MNKKKQTNTQQQQYSNTYGWEAPPITKETQHVLDMANKPTQVDPSIGGRYGALEAEIVGSYDDPLGSYTTAGVREKSKRTNLLKLGAQKDSAMRQGYNEAQNNDWMKANAAAAYTAPQLVSTGGSSNGTSNTQQTGGFWQSVIPGLASGAGAA